MEDVPEEPEAEPEPEEPKEASVQNTEPEHHQETSIQNLESVVEPVIETIPALISPPGEPVQTAAPTPTLIPPAPGLLRDSVEPEGADLQPATDDADLNDEGSGPIKNKEEEEEEEAEGCAAPDSVKEVNICEPQEGMSTQQVQCHTGKENPLPQTQNYVYLSVNRRGSLVNISSFPSSVFMSATWKMFLT